MPPVTESAANALPACELPAVHPDRRTPRRRPRDAWRHFQNLVADKEDTTQVFEIIDALAGPAFQRNARNFLRSPNAAALLEQDSDLVPYLDDHDRLLAMPEGSLAHAYVAFMRREGLSAAGLEAEYRASPGAQRRHPDVVEWLTDRLRSTHDLFHILTGYGRDALGEQCLLGFTYSQNPNLGIGFIAYVGGLEMKHRVPGSRGVLRAVREGQRLGKRADKIHHQDIEALLPRPLAEVRSSLNIGEPARYYAVLANYRAAGLDPYDFLGENTVAA